MNNLGFRCSKHNIQNISDFETLYVQTQEFIKSCNGEQVRFATDTCKLCWSIFIFIVAFLDNAAIEYSLGSVCVCVCVCVRACVRACVFDIELRRFKVKVTVGIQSLPIYHNTNCQVLCFNFGTS